MISDVNSDFNTPAGILTGTDLFTVEGWAFGAPRVGWLALVEDESVLSAYKSGGWSAGVAI